MNDQTISQGGEKVKTIKFDRAKQRSVPNLYLATINGKEVGLIYKLSKNSSWVSCIGVGETAKLIGRSSSFQGARQLVSLSVF
jgi:hypothetical protein